MRLNRTSPVNAASASPCATSRRMCRQVNGDVDSAWLVRGADTHGNFVLETPPVADMDDAARAEHARIMQLRQSVLYKGVAGQPAHTAV